MSKIVPVKVTNSVTPQEVSLTPAAAAVVEAVKALFKALPPIDQDAALNAIQALRPPNATPRAGVVLGTVVDILEHARATRKDWTVREIKHAVSEKGVEAKPREIFNAVAYLARRNRVRQVGYGKYVLLDYGVGVATLDGFDAEPCDDG
jgi:hypothetical protein